MNKKLIILLILFVLVTGCGKKDTSSEIESGIVTCTQKNTILKNNSNAILVDVRTEDEYNSSHLENAINIPYENIVEGLSKIEGVDPTETPIIVYCKSGNRSGQAYNSLKMAGYTKVYDLGAITNCQSELSN